uniref:Histidine phosphatase family protein n=1 Tax=Alexandrium monilatum TaxID=311494 RepID=A0A7S4R2M5_9DINO
MTSGRCFATPPARTSLPGQIEPCTAGAVGSRTPAHTGDKVITFLRHGKSAGNAGVQGVFEMGSLMAYRDGLLVGKGEQQVVERVEAMDDELMQRIVEAEVVLVSPLARALATAVIVLAQAHRRSFQMSGRAQTTWPRVEVVTELREKVKSHSERPGSGEDPLAYIRAIAEKYGKSAYGNGAAMQTVAEEICRSYDRERAATRNWEWEPDDAVSYHQMIGHFKERLRSREETNILLVGHSGWARFAFSALLPASEKEDCARQRLNLVTGVREVRALHNAGVLVARFNTDECRFKDLSMLCGSHATEKLPNFEREDALGILGSPAEAIAAGVVPRNSDFDRIVLLKLAEYTATWEARLFTFAALGSEAFLCWASKWGEPKDYITISSGSTTITRLGEDVFIISEVEGHRPFKVRGRTAEDSARFLELFISYRSRHRSADLNQRLAKAVI